MARVKTRVFYDGIILNLKVEIQGQAIFVYFKIVVYTSKKVPKENCTNTRVVW